MYRTSELCNAVLLCAITHQIRLCLDFEQVGFIPWASSSSLSRLLSSPSLPASDALERLSSQVSSVLRTSGVPKGFEKFYKDKEGDAPRAEGEEEARADKKTASKDNVGQREDPPSPGQKLSKTASSDKGLSSSLFGKESSKTGGGGGGGGKQGGGGFSNEDMQKIYTAVGFGAVALVLMAGMNYLSYREISWKEFVNNFLARGTVDKLVVVNGKWVKVFLSEGAQGTSSSEQLFFTIGSVDTFQRMLETSQQELQLDSSGYALSPSPVFSRLNHFPHFSFVRSVPVVYKSQIELSSIASALPTLLLIAFLIFSFRRAGTMMGGGGAGGGGGGGRSGSGGKKKYFLFVG